jgi:hypothetical protein
MTGALIRIEAPARACNAQYLMAIAPSGDFTRTAMGHRYDIEGKTFAEKLKNFAWTKLQQTFTPVIDLNRTRT